MSIAVALTALPAEIARFGARAFLVTNSTERPPHVASVHVAVRGSELEMRVGRTARANAIANAAVTVMWTAEPEAEYCLIGDGTAHEGSTEAFVVVPTSAVLHRLAPRVPTDDSR